MSNVPPIRAEKSQGMTRRSFCRLGLAAAGAGLLYVALPSMPRVDHRPPIELIGGERVYNPSSIIPREFTDLWIKRLPALMDKALDLPERGGFVIEVEGAKYIWRPQDADIVSEGMGYWMKELTDVSTIFKDRKDLIGKYQENFNGLLAGAEHMENENGLPCWRAEYIEEGKQVESRNLDDRRSATDADLYITWALIQADALVKGGVWAPHPKGENYYRDKAASYLARIKAYEVVEKNDRKILTVSDSWGHKDLPREAITINPSYVALAALRDIAEFDKRDALYWLEIRRDNFEVVQKAVEFSQTLFEQIANPEGNAVRIDIGPKTFYTFSWVHRDLLINLLGRAGYELTPFGVDEKRSPEERNRYDTSRRNRGDEIVYSAEEGKLIIEKECLDEALEIIKASQVVPFVPDQLEVLITEDGRIRPRIEFGEANLTYVEKYDGIRGPEELGKELLVNLDSDLPTSLRITEKAKSLLTSLYQDKDPKEVRVDIQRNIIPIACYLTAAAGLSDLNGFNAFSAEFKESGIFDPVEGRSRYYTAAIAFRVLSQLLSSTTAPLKIHPYDKEIEKVGVSNNTRRDPLPEPNWIGVPEIERIIPLAEGEELRQWRTGINSLDAPLYYFVRTALNEGLKPGPQYSITALKMYFDAKEQLKYYPNDPEVMYNHAAALRNIGFYHEAAEEFYRTLLRARFEKHEEIILAATTNFITILRTLHVSDGEIADIYESLLETGDFELGKRLYIRATAIKIYNRAGNPIKALKHAIKFMEEYKELKNDKTLLGRMYEEVRNYAHKTEAPRKGVLVDVLTEVMDAIAKHGRIERLNNIGGVSFDRSFEVVRYEYEAAQLIPEIVAGAASVIRSEEQDISKVLRLVQDLKGEVPSLYGPRLKLAQAKIKQQQMKALYLEVFALRSYETISRKDDETSLFDKQLEEALACAESSEQLFFDALETELGGERNPFFLIDTLKAFSQLYLDIPEIRYEISTRKTGKERKALQSQGLKVEEYAKRDAEITRRNDHEYWNTISLDFKKSLAIYKLLLHTFSTLDIEDYLGRASRDASELRGINSLFEQNLAKLKIFLPPDEYSKLEKKYAGFLDRAKVISSAALIIAKLNPSADPRNVLYLSYRIELIKAIEKWAEFLPTVINRAANSSEVPVSEIEDKKGRLDEAFAECINILEDLRSENLALSNLEHKIDFVLQTTLELGKITRGYKIIEEQKSLSARLLTRSSELEERINILKAIFSAALEGKEVNLGNMSDRETQQKISSIVGFLLETENQKLLRKFYKKFPKREAEIWAWFGNVTQWGETNVNLLRDAIEYYKASNRVSENLDAYKGLTELYLNPAIKLTIEVETMNRTFRKCLQIADRGGIDKTTRSSVLGIAQRLANETESRVSKKLVYVLNGGASDEIKIKEMINILTLNGY
jgi:hypothetical protein